tara:strand:- start:209 stop:538 length:330 start_codon:yes stop_codon:yes gene_type:complete
MPLTIHTLAFLNGHNKVNHTFSDEELYDMDVYLWLDYTIEVLWSHYKETYMGKFHTSEEEEEEIIRMMGTIYSLEESIIDVLTRGSIDFSMITAYKELYNVSNWPTRFC